MKYKKLIMGALATLGLAAGTASAQSADMSVEAIAERLEPVGELCLVGEECGGAAPVAATGGGGGAGSGEEIYASVCMACHDTGAAGAPKRGDAAAWASRMEKGMDILYAHAIEGFNAMPARGGNPNLSDQEVKDAVNYLTAPVRGEDVAIDTGDVAAPAEAAPAEGGAAEVAAAGGGSDIDGAAIYAQVCTACHATGVAGAPKRGDAAAWAPRLEKGMETLYSSAIHGLGVMPPKGGNPNLTDAEVKAAVDHLLAPVQGDDTGGAAAPADAASADAAPAEGATADAAAAEDGAAPAEAGSAPAEGGGTEVAAAGGSDIDGATIYAQVCTACHATGVAGAPKRGDAAAWATRLEKGMETLYSSAIHGLGVMPPKGGNPNLTEAEVKAAVDYLIAPVQ